MRHRFAGRKFGRNPKHQRALMRMLAVSLILTEREDDDKDFELTKGNFVGAPKVKGRMVTTLQKAKEVRPFVEKCITIAKRALPAKEASDAMLPKCDRRSPEWDAWRKSEDWAKWNQAVAPVLAARRQLIQLLHDEKAVRMLFDVIAPRFVDRQGGYTRVLRLAKPRLGDAGTRALIEFVGKNDRPSKEALKPNFGGEQAAK